MSNYYGSWNIQLINSSGFFGNLDTEKMLVQVGTGGRAPDGQNRESSTVIVTVDELVELVCRIDFELERHGKKKSE